MLCDNGVTKEKMMNTFEQDKADKLQRIMPLRIANALGMVAWQEDEYRCAYQRMRLLHPLTWPLFCYLVMASVIMRGVPETIESVQIAMKTETVWW
jgi:hypothetical protein